MIQLSEIEILLLKIGQGLLELGIDTLMTGVIEGVGPLMKLLKPGLKWLLRDIKSM